MPTLIAVPFLGVLLMLQTVVVSRLPLLHGTADIILLALIAWSLHERVRTAWIWTLVGGLMVSFVSALPGMAALIGYLMVTMMTRLIRRSIWQTPILAMFLCTFLGTLITHGISLFLLQVQGVALPLAQALNLVTLPSALMNILLALPVYAIVHDLAGWLYPQEVEV